MKPWTQSAACQSRAPDICSACRTDRAFRESIVRAGKADDPEFPCPHGFTADKLPIRGLGDLVAKVATPIARALGLPCIDGTGKLKEESPCAKRRDALNRLGK